MTESFELPEEINLEGDGALLVGEDGAEYTHEKDGVKYGGDFLPELPAEISLEDEEGDDFPPAPPEVNLVI